MSNTVRFAWAGNYPLMVPIMTTSSVPVHDYNANLSSSCSNAAQAVFSCSTIFKKRQAYRAAFANQLLPHAAWDWARLRTEAFLRDGTRTRDLPDWDSGALPLSYALHMAEAVTLLQSAHDGPYAPTDCDGQEGELGTQPYWRLGRDLNPLAISRLADNPNSTARLKLARPDGNRTHISQD